MNDKRVVVSSAESPSLFYVLPEDFLKAEKQFNESIQLEVGEAFLPGRINLKDVYYAKDNGQWYRVRVEKILPEGNSVEAFFIDYGSRRVLSQSKLRTAFNKCKKNIDGTATKCSLVTKVQLPEPGAWTKEMKDLFKFLVSKR